MSEMSELSKLKWHCRRGVKELDLVLNGYLEKYLSNKINEPTMQSAFSELLELEDPVLYAMLLGEIKPENEQQEQVLTRLRSLTKR